MHSKLLLLLLCLGKNGCTELRFSFCFGKTSGMVGRAATYDCADYGLPTPGRAIHMAIYWVAQCASHTSVYSSSKHLTGLLSLSTLRLPTTDWDWSSLRRRWLWSREVFHRSCFSSQAKPFLLALDCSPRKCGWWGGLPTVSVQEPGGWWTGGRGEWAQRDAKPSMDSIISEPL